MTQYDKIALIIFIIYWLGYEPLLRFMSKKSGVISKDLSVVRANWMRRLMGRETRLFDSQLIGHTMNSASFFASANLILIAAIMGAAFGGNITSKAVQNLGIVPENSMIFGLKMALILVCLIRGFLDFTWALRQMNYCAASFGAIPENLSKERAQVFSDALVEILEPAMVNFSQGVRGYYFALAAAAWFYGPLFLGIAAVGAVLLLAYRQLLSPTALGIKKLRQALDEYSHVESE